MAERWAVVKDFPRYEVSDGGKVRIVATGALLRTHIRRGYDSASLSRDGRGYTRRINRLVLIAFRSAPPDDSMHARHLNGDETDNRLENLAWGTPHENEQDKRRHGTYHDGEKNPAARLTREQVEAIRREYVPNSRHASHRALGARYRVNRSTIALALHGKTWPVPQGGAA